MDQVAQSAVIATVSNCPLEWRMQTLTQAALRLWPIHERKRKQRFSTDAAQYPRERTQRLQACLANWKSGNFDQRGVADTAVGGKKRKKETSCSLLRPMARTCCMTMGRRYSKASTAEGGLPRPGEQRGDSRLISYRQYRRGRGRYATRSSALESRTD